MTIIIRMGLHPILQIFRSARALSGLEYHYLRALKGRYNLAKGGITSPSHHTYTLTTPAPSVNTSTHNSIIS